MSNVNVCLVGDNRDVLPTLESGSVQMCVTSPPYFGLRDYQVNGQIGLEPTPDAYVSELVKVFREVKRVLRNDGTLWLNLGDSYAAQRGGTCMPAETLAGGIGGKSDYDDPLRGRVRHGQKQAHRDAGSIGLKHKDLIGIPWRVAFALQADGWWLRQEIIWHKPSVMPESVTDRCTKAHEHIFLLAKSERYYFDNEAIKEPSEYPDDDRKGRSYDHHKSFPDAQKNGIRPGNYLDGGRAGYPMRNKRSVWSVTNAGYSGSHFSTFPPKLIEPCILAGSRPGDTVLDPFGGSGTTGMVSEKLGRNWLLIELNPAYEKLSRERTAQTGLCFL